MRVAIFHVSIHHHNTAKIAGTMAASSSRKRFVFDRGIIIAYMALASIAAFDGDSEEDSYTWRIL